MEIMIGFVIALIVGMTGMGGGSLTVPVLMLFLGIPATTAVGTALLYTTLTKVIATPMYWARGQVDRKIMKPLLLGGIPGVAIGSVLISRINSQKLQPVVLTLVGFTIAAMALLSLWRLYGKGLERPTRQRTWLIPILTFGIGLEVGFSSAGAGALGSLVLMYCTTLQTTSIVGTELLFGLILSLLGGGLHLAGGGVDMTLLWKLCLGGVAGAWMGAHLGGRVPARQLRTALSGVLLVLGGQLLWRGMEAWVR